MRPSSFAAGHRLWVASMLAVFGVMIGLRYETGKGLSALIQFDTMFEARSNPVLRTIPHHVRSPTGFDGQFYAQVALDPLLRDPATKSALDVPAYRSRRILMPAMAYAAGLGQPRWIIFVYPFIDLGFWLLLLWLLLKYLRPANAFQRVCVTAVVFSAGLLDTVRLALPDLPATVLMLLPYFVAMSGGGTVIALACGCLCRETSVLGAAAYFGHRAPSDQSLAGRACQATIAVLPLAGWMVHVHSRFGSDTLTGGNLALPLTAAAQTLRTNALRFATELSPGALGAVAIIVGLHVQAAYLWLNRSWADPFWRLGVVFSVVLVVLGPKVWEAPLAACRDVLPMTIAFNILLLRRARPSWQLFAWGNACSLYGLFKVFTYTS